MMSKNKTIMYITKSTLFVAFFLNRWAVCALESYLNGEVTDFFTVERDGKQRIPFPVENAVDKKYFFFALDNYKCKLIIYFVSRLFDGS